MLMLASMVSDRIARYARYRRTVSELRSMPLDVALDLDFYKPDAKRMAARAVYGA